MGAPVRESVAERNVVRTNLGGGSGPIHSASGRRWRAADMRPKGALREVVANLIMLSTRT